MKKQRCYIYTRVSTSMQVDGYSLDAQRDKLWKYAAYQEMTVAGEYSDEGRSGKNVEGRPAFVQMLSDIEAQKDNVDFVLVFKLSRFGRNAADVLTSLQRMQDYGVNLICVEDGIDSSKDSGKLMISVLSAVAEIERENILVQTMEGRRQKAREGRWNGGFAPYGYALKDGALLIDEEEAEIIRLIYDKFIHTNMGINAISKYLNMHGYKKKLRQNNTIEGFSTAFLKGVLDNPVYCGKIAYGRRKTERIQGTRNQYHIVKQDEFPVYDGIHEAIISEADWNAAHQKRLETGLANDKTHSLEHEHILSGIVKCPVCGAGLYGNVNRKKKGDGTYYQDYFYYACKHRLNVDGHRCTYRKQWREELIDEAVAEIVTQLVGHPQFVEAMREKVSERLDVSAMEQDIEAMKKQRQQYIGAKDRLGHELDSLDVTDSLYEKKYQDMQGRLNALYDDIEAVEQEITRAQRRLERLKQDKINGDNVYQFLLCFDQFYDMFSDKEKKEFMKSFIERIDLYPERKPNGQIIRRMKFNFPVYINGRKLTDLDWDNEDSAESVVLMSRDRASRQV